MMGQPVSLQSNMEWHILALPRSHSVVPPRPCPPPPPLGLSFPRNFLWKMTLFMTLFSPSEQIHIALQVPPYVHVAGCVDSVTLWTQEVSEDSCALHRCVLLFCV